MQFSYALSTTKVMDRCIACFNLFQHFKVLTLEFDICLMLMLNINSYDIITGVITSNNDFKK